MQQMQFSNLLIYWFVKREWNMNTDLHTVNERLQHFNGLFYYQTTATGAACGGAAPIAISSADQTMIVNMHNTLRSKVALGKQSGQPIATNMRQMVWLKKYYRKLANFFVI